MPGMTAHIVPIPRNYPDASLKEVVDAVTIRRMEDINPGARALAMLARERDFRVATCDDISSTAPMVDAEGTIINADIFGYTGEGEQWWEDRRLALHSPLASASRYESEPFWVNAQGFHGAWGNKYLEQIDLSDFENEVLGRSTMVIPVHLPFAQISTNCFSPLDNNKTDLAADFAEHGQLLSAAVRRFISGYVQVMRDKHRIPSDCSLSKREVECLRWAAIGKTDMEISMILERSHATVRYHVHRAGEKLNAVNRAQAIFKAGQLGYLGANG